jgi:hypothetical protein
MIAKAASHEGWVSARLDPETALSSLTPGSNIHQGFDHLRDRNLDLIRNHREELEGLAPTGARVSVTGISIDLWKDGKVVESWTEWDNLGLARQLGAAPPEGSIGDKIGMGLQRLMARRMRKKNQG